MAETHPQRASRARKGIPREVLTTLLRKPLLSFAFVLALGFRLGGGTAQAAEKLRVEIDGLGSAGIAGIGGSDLRRNVLAALSIDDARKEKNLTEERIRRLHAQAPQEIESALQPFGYYRPSIQGSLERDGSTWVARYRIDPGPALRVTVLDVHVEGTGAEDPGFRQREASFPLRQGDVLLQPAYEVGKQAFVDYAAAEGYLDADFTTSEIRIDLATYTADVVLHFATGPRYLFGPVTFRQDFLDPRLLQGYITFKQGETLNVDKLLEMQRALSDSPYFQRVEVLPRQDLAQGLEVPIEVDLVAAKHQRWHTGLGYGTDTGPRATALLELRRINRHGHRGQIEIKASQIDKSFLSSYQIPGAYPRTDVITFDAGYAELNPRTSESRALKLDVSRGQARGQWREAYSLGFLHEGFTIGLDKGTAKLLMPEGNWSLVRADDRIYTTHGQRVQIDLRGASSAVVSSSSFVQQRIEGTLIRSFAGRFRFTTRAQIGATQTSQFHALPPTVRFFAGGDQSVRGYAYQQLGDRDANGHVIGGKDLRTGSVELEYRIIDKYRFLEKVGIAVFFDAGNASSTFSGPLEKGTGVGLRVLSPIGPVHIDAAWAITEPGHPLRFHFTVGPDL